MRARFGDSDFGFQVENMPLASRRPVVGPSAGQHQFPTRIRAEPEHSGSSTEQVIGKTTEADCQTTSVAGTIWRVFVSTPQVVGLTTRVFSKTTCRIGLTTKVVRAATCQFLTNYPVFCILPRLAGKAQGLGITPAPGVAGRNAASAEESVAAAEDLNVQAEVLKQSVSELLQLVGGNQGRGGQTTVRPGANPPPTSALRALDTPAAKPAVPAGELNC
jgi:hypothetical protein